MLRCEREGREVGGENRGGLGWRARGRAGFDDAHAEFRRDHQHLCFGLIQPDYDTHHVCISTGHSFFLIFLSLLFVYVAPERLTHQLSSFSHHLALMLMPPPRRRTGSRYTRHLTDHKSHSRRQYQEPFCCISLIF